MTPEQHYEKAEYWLNFLTSKRSNLTDPRAREVAALAQVHATLATISTPPLGANQ